MKSKKSIINLNQDPLTLKREVRREQTIWEICSFCRKRSTIEEKSSSLFQAQYQGRDFFTCDKCKEEGEKSIKNFPEVARHIYLQTVSSNENFIEQFSQFTKEYTREYEKAKDEIKKLKIMVNRITIASKEIKLKADTLKKIIAEKEREIEKYAREKEFTINSIVEISMFASMLGAINNSESFEYIKMNELDNENRKGLVKNIDQISRILLSSLRNKSIEDQMGQMVIQESQASSSSASYIYME